MATRRRGRSKTRYSESTNASAEPMDEDDQIELIESLEKEALEQTMFFQKIYGFGIGGMAIVVSLIFPLLCPDECRETPIACWCHAMLSSAVHAWQAIPFAFQIAIVNGPPHMAVDSTFQLIPIVIWLLGFFGNDEDQFHLALLIGNLVTFLGSRLMYWDIQSTKKSLESLDAARYKHKSL